MPKWHQWVVGQDGLLMLQVGGCGGDTFPPPKLAGHGSTNTGHDASQSNFDKKLFCNQVLMHEDREVCKPQSHSATLEITNYERVKLYVSPLT